jgi:putative MFS transporter
LTVRRILPSESGAVQARSAGIVTAGAGTNCLESLAGERKSSVEETEQTMAEAVFGATTLHGHIAARVDRLPLTRVQWYLAILVEVTWGFIIVDTDGIGARLYPFVWRPNHLITVTEYAVIQALQVGLGVLLGAYLMSWVAGKYGRRPAILGSAILAGICLWPFAYATDFWLLVLLSVLSTLGVGGIVATHAVYLSEVIGPHVRSKVLLASQSSTALVGVGISLLAFAWIPVHWQWFVWAGSLCQIVLLVPLLYWFLPESPRWLEAHGRLEEADRVMSELEERVRRVTNAPLPEPDHGQHPLLMSDQAAWRELFSNRRYRGRIILILVCWLCCYPGIIYGVGAFASVYMVDHGVSAHFVFMTFTVAYLATFFAFQFNSWLGENVERRDTLFLIGVIFVLVWVVAYFWPTAAIMAVCVVIGRICTGLFLFNLYNYTAVSFPTRIRSVAFAWTDGLGHLGAWAGVTLTGPLYVMGPNHLGWVLFITLPGALLPALLIRGFGIRQSRAVLEQVST